MVRYVPCRPLVADVVHQGLDQHDAQPARLARLERQASTSGSGRASGSKAGPSSATVISTASPSRLNHTSKTWPPCPAAAVGDDVGDDLVQGDLQPPGGLIRERVRPRKRRPARSATWPMAGAAALEMGVPSGGIARVHRLKRLIIPCPDGDVL